MWIVCVLFVICIGLSLTRGDFHKEYFSKNQMLPIRGGWQYLSYYIMYIGKFQENVLLCFSY